MFESAEHAYKELNRVGYLAGPERAKAVYHAALAQKPLLLEGPAGAGKTELAVALQRATGRHLIRLQCYNGIESADAIGRFSEPLRTAYVNTHVDKIGWEKTCASIQSREFFLAGPLLQSIDADDPCILLIDEIDKVSYAFEAVLLEFLSVWQISQPELGTVTARSVPFVVLTSNAERELGNALRRRCYFIPTEYPTPETEAEIISRLPNCPEGLKFFMAGLMIALRNDLMEKPPSIAEGRDLALAMMRDGRTELGGDDLDYLPLIAKTTSDRELLMVNRGENFSRLIGDAHGYAKMLQDEHSKKKANVAATEIAGETCEAVLA